MPEGDVLRQGQAAVSQIFRDTAKLKRFLEEVKESGINIETCGFRQIEGFVREMAPQASAIPARGGRAVGSYQDLTDNELEVLQQLFRQVLKESKLKHPELFK